ncbi:MAG: hypothetical protein QW212_06965 [Nitrososphaerales archaeon]
MSDILVQAASGVLALLLLTSFFFFNRLFRGSALSRGLNLFLVGSLLLTLRPSILIILYIFDLTWIYGWLDFFTSGVFVAGLLWIKNPLERLAKLALDKSIIRQLNLEEDSVKS